MSACDSSVKPDLLTMARLAFVLSSASCCVRIGAQQPSVTVEAELVQPLDAGHAKVGDAAKARVKVAWTDPTCTLKAECHGQKSHRHGARPPLSGMLLLSREARP